VVIIISMGQRVLLGSRSRDFGFDRGKVAAPEMVIAR
jgi:hypothetical protein